MAIKLAKEAGKATKELRDWEKWYGVRQYKKWKTRISRLQVGDVGSRTKLPPYLTSAYIVGCPFCKRRRSSWKLTIWTVRPTSQYSVLLLTFSWGSVRKIVLNWLNIWVLISRPIIHFLEKEMATHSSTLARKIPSTEEPGRRQSMGLRRVGHDWVTSLSLFTFIHWRREWQPTPVFLPGESQGQRSLVGCHLWGCTESDTTEAT